MHTSMAVNVPAPENSLLGIFPRKHPRFDQADMSGRPFVTRLASTPSRQEELAAASRRTTYIMHEELCKM